MDKTNKELEDLIKSDSKSHEKKREDSLKSRMKEPVLESKPSHVSAKKVTGKVESKPLNESSPVKDKEAKCCKSCDCVKFSKAEMKGLLSHLPAWSERENVMAAKDKLLKALK